MKFISGLQVDRNGNSVPGAYPLTEQQQAAVQLREIQAARLGRVAASAEERLHTNPTLADLDEFCQARGFSVTERIAVKRAVLEQAEPLDSALKRMRLS